MEVVLKFRRKYVGVSHCCGDSIEWSNEYATMGAEGRSLLYQYSILVSMTTVFFGWRRPWPWNIPWKIGTQAKRRTMSYPFDAHNQFIRNTKKGIIHPGFGEAQLEEKSSSISSFLPTLCLPITLDRGDERIYPPWADGWSYPFSFSDSCWCKQLWVLVLRSWFVVIIHVNPLLTCIS